MKIEELELNDLMVNRANDRHGELENEASAIAWLFNTRETHMKNLAKDIVAEGKLYELPLVAPDNGSYIVFDGNRRVTCLKVLAQPSRAPTTQLQNYFQKLSDTWEGDFPTTLLCQIEEDRDHIDGILYRRHTGTLGGVGQSTWDDRMKDNFVARSGKEVGFNVADEIERQLGEANLLPTKKIPRSNINRLLSSEAIRNRVGFSVKKKTFTYTHNKDVVLKAMARIAIDFSSGKIVLGDIWDNKGKRTYLNLLDEGHILPTAEDLLVDKEQSRTGKGKAKKKTTKPTHKSKLELRTSLIPQTDFGIIWTGKLQRHHAIWEELQFHLNLQFHPNAISVLFRVLLELSVENYVDVHGANVHENDKLANKVKKVGEDLFAKGKIDKSQLTSTKKFGQLDQLVSADTLNKYVHSPHFAPSGKHLEAMWDTMASFIVNCLEA